MEIKEVIEICELDYTLFPDDNEYLNEASKILKKVYRGELVELKDGEKIITLEQQNLIESTFEDIKVALDYIINKTKK